jgi:hypothetical protein
LLVLALTASYIGVRVFIRNGRPDTDSSGEGPRASVDA